MSCLIFVIVLLQDPVASALLLAFGLSVVLLSIFLCLVRAALVGVDLAKIVNLSSKMEPSELLALGHVAVRKRDEIPLAGIPAVSVAQLFIVRGLQVGAVSNTVNGKEGGAICYSPLIAKHGA